MKKCIRYLNKNSNCYKVTKIHKIRHIKKTKFNKFKKVNHKFD